MLSTYNNTGNQANMESQLRDANWRLQQLQTQYDFLASKSFTQGNAYKDAEEKAEVTNITSFF